MIRSRSKTQDKVNLILKNFSSSWKNCYPWRCTKYMSHIKCIGKKEGSELLCAMNYENIMSHPRFDNIMKHIQLLLNIDDDQQSLDFIDK